MKSKLKILLYALAYVILCSRSCTDDTDRTLFQEKEAISARDTLRHQFETDELSEEARNAMELLAIQKVKDLSSYLEIYSNAALDNDFRTKAGEMIRSIFTNHSNTLTFGRLKNDKMKIVNLKEFLSEGFGEDVLSVRIDFDSILVSNSLQNGGKGYYNGRLEAYQKVEILTLSDTVEMNSTKITVDFSAYRVLKSFGTDTLHIWNVAIGRMQAVN
jgi:hypothetical protein